MSTRLFLRLLSQKGFPEYIITPRGGYEYSAISCTHEMRQCFKAMPWPALALGKTRRGFEVIHLKAESTPINVGVVYLKPEKP